MGKIGFFEVCCREKTAQGKGTDYTERSEHFSDRLTHLQTLAKESGGPFVFTICCAERFMPLDDAGDVVVVPRDTADDGWMKKTMSHSVFNIEKKADSGDIAKDDADLIFDMFLHNPNAGRLIEKLGITQWIVYGVGIDLCVSSAVKGLLKAGLDVTVLTDVLTSNEGGDSESMAKMLDQLREMGATTTTYSEFVSTFQSEAK